MNRKTILGFLILCLAIPSSGFAQDKVRTEIYLGEAKEKDKLVYRERHVVHFSAEGDVLDAETVYRDPDGKVIGTLKSDFRKSITAPDHDYKNTITGNRNGIRNSGGNLVLFTQDNNAKEETKTLDPSFSEGKMVFGCQGLHYYLKDNLDKVRNAVKIPIKFLIPAKLDGYNFVLVYKSETPDGIVDFDIIIDNVFLRIFAPKLEVKYDKNKKRIIWYRGLSNITDAKGRTKTVTITYDYDQPA